MIFPGLKPSGKGNWAPLGWAVAMLTAIAKTNKNTGRRTRLNKYLDLKAMKRLVLLSFKTADFNDWRWFTLVRLKAYDFANRHP
jgi:hypothetical protein